jgi:tRNA-splicing ligase RtcB
MRTFSVDQGIPIRCWARDPDEGSLKQARNLARLPFAVRQIAVMPDCHKGFGMPIGGVLASENVIVPNAVGVDIGCGVLAVRTSLTGLERTDVVRILEDIRDLVPTGFKHHPVPKEWEGFSRAPGIPVIQRELESSRRQLGTLGGGNHFIEIQKEKDGPVWVMLHSGSRNFGLKIASEYHRRALKECRRQDIELPDDELAFLAFDSELGQEYFSAMGFAVEFAAANRAEMMTSVKQVLTARMGCSFDLAIDVRHNYAAIERHFGRTLVVHRKGAIAAFPGQAGLIPGSQGTSSFVVEGMGNPESFMSCSHGAGRRMSRKEADKTLKEADCEAAMRGIVHGAWNRHYDEAPQAYKDFRKVMADQDDLVSVRHILDPIGVVKGDAGLLN